MFFISDFMIGQSCLTTEQMLSINKSTLNIIAVSSEKEQEPGLKDKCRLAGADVRRILNLDEHKNFRLLAKQIAKLIRKEDIHCVHVQNNWQMMLVVYAKYILLKCYDIKILYTIHAFRNNHPVKSIIARITIGCMLGLFATKVICMSSYLKQKFRFLGKKIALLPLGISNEYFHSEHPALPLNGLQMIFPAQFRKGKNQDVIIKAFAKHIELCKDYQSHLYLPGNGEFYEDMKKLASDLCIADRISFPGRITKRDLLQMYLKCNIGVIASNSETFGQSIVEPFVLGRCIVSTHVGIADDIITNGENGYFFSSQDELVNVFGKLYKNQELIVNAGIMNFKGRNTFSWDNVTKQYIELINKL